MTVTSVTAVAVSFRSISTSPSTPADTAASQPAGTAPAGPAPAGKADRRADTLLTRLDTDRDGAISKDEFTSGGIELLKKASVRAHHRHVGQGEGIDKRDERWRARLERVFDRIDADGDGAVSRDELNAGFQRQEGSRGKGPEEPAGPPPAMTFVTSVTLVAMAIRRYTVDATAAPTPEAPAPVAPLTSAVDEPLVA